MKIIVELSEPRILAVVGSTHVTDEHGDELTMIIRIPYNCLHPLESTNAKLKIYWHGA